MAIKTATICQFRSSLFVPGLAATICSPNRRFDFARRHWSILLAVRLGGVDMCDIIQRPDC